MYTDDLAEGNSKAGTFCFCKLFFRGRVSYTSLVCPQIYIDLPASAKITCKNNQARGKQILILVLVYSHSKVK